MLKLNLEISKVQLILALFLNVMTISILAAASSAEERLYTADMNAGLRGLIRSKMTKIPEGEREKVVTDILAAIPADLPMTSDDPGYFELKLNLLGHYNARDRWEYFVNETRIHALSQTEWSRLLIDGMTRDEQLIIRKWFGTAATDTTTRNDLKGLVDAVLAAIPSDFDARKQAKARVRLMQIYNQPERWASFIDIISIMG